MGNLMRENEVIVELVKLVLIESISSEKNYPETIKTRASNGVAGYQGEWLLSHDRNFRYTYFSAE